LTAASIVRMNSMSHLFMVHLRAHRNRIDSVITITCRSLTLLG
jgi:hypothetical protein